jgi:hypothetical protein
VELPPRSQEALHAEALEVTEIACRGNLSTRIRSTRGRNSITSVAHSCVFNSSCWTITCRAIAARQWRSIDRPVNIAHDINELLRELERCRFESQLPWRCAKHEPKVNVNDVAFGVTKNVSVVTILRRGQNKKEATTTWISK